MKLLTKLNSIDELKRGTRITLDFTDYPYSEQVKQLDTDTQYAIEITKAKSKRSIQQNKYMWALLRDMASYTGVSDEMDLYYQFLELADVEYEYLLLDMGVASKVSNVFRGMKYIKQQEVDGVTKELYKCYLGSSTFTSDEMARLIDTIIAQAYKLGVPTADYYSDLLK